MKKMLNKAGKPKGGLHMKKTKMSGKTIGAPEGGKGKGSVIRLGSGNTGTSKLDGMTK